MHHKADANTQADTSQLMDRKALYLVAVTLALPALSVVLPATPNQDELDRITSETTKAIQQLKTDNFQSMVATGQDGDHPSAIHLTSENRYGRLTTRITLPGLCHRLVRSVLASQSPGDTKPFTAALLNGQRFTPAQAMQGTMIKAHCIMATYNEPVTEIQFLYLTHP